MDMQTVKILHRYTQEVLFECEVSKSFREGEAKGQALLKAAETPIDLSYADLRGCVLRCGDLEAAQLDGADFTDSDMLETNFYGSELTKADFTNAELRNCIFDNVFATSTNFTDADLSNASFMYARLYNANFTNASLDGVIGDGVELFSIQTNRYPVTVWKNVIQIGCQRHTIDTWKLLSDRQISSMDIGALDWWRKWKEPLLQIVEVNRK